MSPFPLDADAYWGPDLKAHPGPFMGGSQCVVRTPISEPDEVVLWGGVKVSRHDRLCGRAPMLRKSVLGFGICEQCYEELRVEAA